MSTSKHRAFKSAFYAQLARVSRALANPHRLELVDLMAQGEGNVEDLARQAAITVANASQHLQRLKSAQLVIARREGACIYYRLADLAVFRAWQAIRDLGHGRLAEVDRLVRDLLGDPAGREPARTEEVAERLESGEVLVLDVRPEREFRAGHIRGARSIPVDELEPRLHELPRDREVIAYCRGPYCAFADEAVALLRRHGYRARRLAIGFPDWRAVGLPAVRR